MASDSRRQNFARTIAGALRIHQWTKNLLVFVAPVLAHRMDAVTLLHGLQAFAALSLASSAAYILNDLFDIKSDRAHPRKRLRPFASGVLSPVTGWLLSPLLLVGSLLTAWWTSERLVFWIVGYSALTLAYSAYLKRVLALDVILLATFYAARLVAGGMATGISISPSALAFAVFLFFSLALMKRSIELYKGYHLNAGGQIPGRPYQARDLPLVNALGSASGMVSVFVIAVYLNGDDVRRLYRHRDVLWIVCLAVLLWVSRMWFVANRGNMDEDPVLFAIQDPFSLAMAAGVIALFVAAV